MDGQNRKIHELNEQISQMLSTQPPEEESAPRSPVAVPNWRNLLHDRKTSNYANPLSAKKTEEVVVEVEETENTIEGAPNTADKPVNPVVEFK